MELLIYPIIFYVVKGVGLPGAKAQGRLSAERDARQAEVAHVSN